MLNNVFLNRQILSITDKLGTIFSEKSEYLKKCLYEPHSLFSNPKIFPHFFHLKLYKKDALKIPKGKYCQV
jgi:hypothetical protein